MATRAQARDAGYEAGKAMAPMHPTGRFHKDEYRRGYRAGQRNFQDNVTATLRDASHLVRKGWVQGVFARNERGSEVPPLNPDACQFCMGGAIWRAASTVGDLAIRQQLEVAARAQVLRAITPGSSISGWNDDKRRTKPEVVEALRNAIYATAPGEPRAT